MLRVAEQFRDTDTGQQRRDNEDSLFVRAPLFVVADGMGGAQAGEVASGMAVEVFEPGLPDGAGSVEARLAELVQAANLRIHERSRQEADRAGMGTTLTAAYVDVDDVAIAHVGDSRAYRWRGDELERLTDDHSLVEELIRQGKLSAEEAEEHPQRSIITRALGPEPHVEVDTRTAPARDGDVFLLCSDGLTSMIGESTIATILAQAPTLRDAGRALIDAANRAGGRDNITVVLFRVEEVAPGTAPADPSTTTAHTVLTRDRIPAAVADPDAARVQPRPARPRASPAAAAPRRRRWGPRLTVLLVFSVLIAAVAIGAYAAINSVYFIGTDTDGRVALYRGVPYDLPFGIDLYATEYRSGVAASALSPARRQTLLDHKLRSHNDAVDLVRQLELGQLQGS